MKSSVILINHKWFDCNFELGWYATTVDNFVQGFQVTGGPVTYLCFPQVPPFELVQLFFFQVFPMAAGVGVFGVPVGRPPWPDVLGEEAELFKFSEFALLVVLVVVVIIARPRRGGCSDRCRDDHLSNKNMLLWLKQSSVIC